MSWKKKTKKFLCQAIFERTREPSVFNEESCEALLRREAIDWLFVGLGAFTHIYLVFLAIFFFGRLAGDLPQLFQILDALQEPYLGALGIYVILKEMRKRRRKYPSRYLGELFVAFWAVILVLSTLLVFFSPYYSFDQIYRIILTNGLVVLLIYIGGFLNKP